jgi:hypothetical protein
MKGWPLSAAGAIALGTMLAGIAQPVRAAEAPACPSFAELGRRVDARIDEIKALKPGLTLKEFTTRFASQGLNFWDDVGSERETVFFVVVAEGNAQVSDELVCRFDRSERLRSCRRECCRGTTRTITEEQYKAVAVGETRPELERRLCSASDSEVDPKKATRVSTYYHIDLPVGHHDEGQTVMFIFEDGKLSSKGMSPYY